MKKIFFSISIALIACTQVYATAFKCREDGFRQLTLRLVGITTEELWINYKTKGDESAKSQLIERHMDLVRFHAQRIHAGLPRSVEVSDLEQEGVFGLIDAIEKFDLGRKIKFTSYAAPRIRGAMLDYLRAIDIVPRRTQARHKRVETIRKQFEQENSRLPTDEEILEVLTKEVGSREEAEKIYRDSDRKETQGLRRRVRNRDRETVELDLPILSDERPGDSVEATDAWEVVLKRFTSDEQRMMTLYYRDGFTMKEIGRQLDYSESRISQMHASIIERLESIYTREELEVLLGIRS